MCFRKKGLEPMKVSVQDLSSGVRARAESRG